jgi:hypothetical protein
MLVAAVLAQVYILVLVLLALVEPAAVETEQIQGQPLVLELLILVVAVVVVVQHRLIFRGRAVLEAPALSSSRPINNEDKWKPKSIGCMESTPQCTC